MIVEFTVRYSTIIALNQYKIQKRPPSNTDQDIIIYLAQPELKACLMILRAIARDLRRIDELIVPEIQFFSIAPSGTVSTGLFLMDTLVTFCRQVADTQP